MTEQEETMDEYIKRCEMEYSFSCLKENNPEGCQNLARFMSTIKNDVKMAANLYQMNCETNGDSFSCMKFGQFICNGAAELPKDFRRGLQYFEKGCNMERFKGTSCYLAGAIHNGSLKKDLPNMQPDTTKALKYFERGCLNGDEPLACLSAAKIYLKGHQEVGEDKVKALDFSKRACDGYLLQGCYNAAVIYKHGDGVPANIKQFEEYKGRYEKLLKELRASKSPSPS